MQEQGGVTETELLIRGQEWEKNGDTYTVYNEQRTVGRREAGGMPRTHSQSERPNLNGMI
jgi:hypothetical protein